MKQVGLLIPIYNRHEYLKRCLDSLAHVQFPPNTVVMLIDDGSTDKETIALFNAATFPVMTIKHRHANRGIKLTMQVGYEFLFKFCDVVINLDSDAIVKPNFITRLLELHKQFPNKIISGFNSKNTTGKDLRNPIIREYDMYIEKRFANGINMLLSKCPDLSKGGNWDFNLSSKETSCIVAKPSLVQHIGLNSTMGHVQPDVACDFKLLNLPNVTLFGIDGHDPKGLLRAAAICQENVDFGSVKIITNPDWKGREAYSKFCISDMAQHVETSHVLIIHPDGYILNPLAWNNEWLQYDYIGALWEWYADKRNGNGGFSLRSKKLLDILATFELNIYHPEDDVICRGLHKILTEEYGIKFAPDDVCRKFSIEGHGIKDPTWNGEFGFHGYRVNMKYVPTELKLAPRHTIRQPVKSPVNRTRRG